MNNHQLESLLHHYLGERFQGVWASDQLSFLERNYAGPAYLIVNTHPTDMPDAMVSNFVKKYQRCVKNRKYCSFNQGTCSMQMFKDCYKL